MSLSKNSYYLGAISPDGFCTHFDEIINQPDYFTYILKGGAGTGKSTLMKTFANEFKDIDDVNVYYCTSDPSSLDAVVLNKRKIIIVDGTAPHTFDPQYPGVKQKIINLGDHWDSEKLKANTDEIIRTTTENKLWHRRCKNFVSAMSSLLSDSYMIAQDALNSKKLSSFITRLSKKIFPKKKYTEGCVSYRQISSLTPQGYKTFNETLEAYTTVYTLDDSLLCGSDVLLRELCSNACMQGYDVIVSECNLLNAKTYEHILIPELKICFLSSNLINCTDTLNTKIINFKRFYDTNILSQKKQRISFNKKACCDLLDEAALALRKAKDIHDEIESYYISAMNFDEINEIHKQLIDEIKSL